MSTRKSQRIGIWIIAGALVIGTIGGFLAMALQPRNDATDQARMESLTAEWQKASQEASEKQAAQKAELFEKYYDELKKYSSRVGKFDADKVTELKTTDLKVGDGETLDESSSFTAYYIGWNPEGEIFDQSIDGESLKDPFLVEPGRVIEGWSKGAVGMKVGGVRELTIPSEMAYGETGSGESIPPNTPLKFVMMVIPTPETIEQPEIPEELLKYYQQQM
ncbi:MAG: FKBP-type peptidyl-prolyl cis-trans isomerase [Psychrobacter sp.]